MTPAALRNVAIIAHVDHGKTTLVDKLLYQSGMFRSEQLDKLAGGQHGLILDSNDLERERGITILSKNCAVTYGRPDGAAFKINLIDTPGHADFGGEVERVLSMADGVLLLVDAFEGPMPQTRFVLAKALGHGLRPIVVVNKIDRPDARVEKVVDEVFDLLVDLGADDDALDFPVLFASARDGVCSDDPQTPGEDLRPVFETIVKHVPPPDGDPDGPLRMRITSLDFSDYVGRIGIGRVTDGTLRPGQPVAVFDRSGTRREAKIGRVRTFDGLGRTEAEQVIAGDRWAVEGLNPIDIGESLTDPETPRPLEPTEVDEPTLHMTFRVNDSPFAGQDGKWLTSRQIRDRLERELQTNVALRVADGASPEEFEVSGRGLMHLGILLETMRREGFELAVGKPRVIFKQIDGKTCEPIEKLVVDCPVECQSAVMSVLGDRRAELEKMDAKSGAESFVHMEFSIPARGLIGIASRLMNATKGEAIVHHTFERYEPMRGPIPGRAAGVMVATENGAVTDHALDALYDRGVFFVRSRQQVYEGQIVGEHCKDNDIIANVVKAKQVTNMRRATKEDAYRIRPPRDLSLEDALAYIEDDELVELTPGHIRMRKRLLKEAERRREARRAAQAS
ncbi:MAG: translational GTPase TypA [Phycisphaeraceae bacterium]|nr:translational GTPase TypA [Phycisphaeraceae bacterium]